MPLLPAEIFVSLPRGWPLQDMKTDCPVTLQVLTYPLTSPWLIWMLGLLTPTQLWQWLTLWKHWMFTKRLTLCCLATGCHSMKTSGGNGNRSSQITPYTSYIVRIWDIASLLPSMLMKALQLKKSLNGSGGAAAVGSWKSQTESWRLDSWIEFPWKQSGNQILVFSDASKVILWEEIQKWPSLGLGEAPLQTTTVIVLTWMYRQNRWFSTTRIPGSISPERGLASIGKIRTACETPRTIDLQHGKGERYMPPLSGRHGGSCWMVWHFVQHHVGNARGVPSSMERGTWPDSADPYGPFLQSELPENRRVPHMPQRVLGRPCSKYHRTLSLEILTKSPVKFWFRFCFSIDGL